MTSKRKNIYIHSVEEFNKWIHDHCEHGMIYHGLKDSRWELSASLYRRLKVNNLSKDMRSFIVATRKLIQDVRESGHYDKMKELELLSKLQHNGAATCLIDFTYNPFIALWFACQPTAGKSSHPGKIAALNTKSLPMVNPENWEKDIEFFLNEKQKHLWKWSPPPQSHRITSQQSVFILGKGIIEDEEIDEICFVAKEAKKNILKELKKYGISESSLFLDFAAIFSAKTPILDILLFQRDMYLLLTMMLADEAISKISEFQDIGTDNYENELNRLLLLTAVSARQLMDSMGSDDKSDISERICGVKLIQKKNIELKFREACNSIIHANDISPYDDTSQSTSERKIPSRECYKGTITIRWEDKKNQKNKTVAKLDGQEYAKSCIILSNKFLKKSP